jgi:formate dehydrogenase major subunit
LVEKKSSAVRRRLSMAAYPKYGMDRGVDAPHNSSGPEKTCCNPLVLSASLPRPGSTTASICRDFMQGAPVLRSLLSRWPLIEQIRTGADGTGPEAMSQRTRELLPKNHGAEVARSICPYCGVGCGQLVYHKQGKLISIEGDPESPISRGHLCPKGADTFELHTHPGRLKKVKYRAPYSRQWEDIELETAMDMVADRVWETRDRTFQEKRDGESLMQTTAMAHLGGATLDNEENYLIKKLFTAGLGMVCVSNQARI